MSAEDMQATHNALAAQAQAAMLMTQAYGRLLVDAAMNEQRLAQGLAKSEEWAQKLLVERSELAVQCEQLTRELDAAQVTKRRRLGARDFIMLCESSGKALETFVDTLYCSVARAKGESDSDFRGRVLLKFEVPAHETEGIPF
jgi:hypothetical protein